MISVKQALQHVLDLFEPLDIEHISLQNSGGRVLAKDVFASRDQPPFSSSAMDGYAVISSDLAPGNKLTVIGEAAAGKRFEGTVTNGTAVRIFTGAPIPKGADRVLIQEDCTRYDDSITVGANIDKSNYIRPLGGDFRKGDVLKSPLVLGPSEISLLASMNIAVVPVHRKPIVALVATGNELVAVGETPNHDQIISSNNYGLKAMIESAGASARMIPIASDTAESLQTAFELCEGADLIVTLGGASVGDHDLVQAVATDLGLKCSFYKVAMRPGKPLMAGLLGNTPMIGLPGNPVSSIVCAHVFLRPSLNAMLGLPKQGLSQETTILRTDLPANGPRAHYMRAVLETKDGQTSIAPLDRQDSSLLTVLSQANALLVRTPNEPAKYMGEAAHFIRL